MSDWQNRSGQVNASMQLPAIDLNKEHSFELQSVDIKEGVTTKYGIKNKVNLVWKEAGKETAFHRVWINFNESYAEKSNLIAFLKRVSPKPILPGTIVKLGDYLDIGMKITTMLQTRIDLKTGLPSGYYDFIPASIKPVTSTETLSNEVLLASALKITQGCVDPMEATNKLFEASAKAEVVQAFLAANKAGTLKFPIQ
jgi:hypothetical protein